jgi:hypothetical protein
MRTAILGANFWCSNEERRWVRLRDCLRLPGDPCSKYACVMRNAIFLSSLALLALHSGCAASQAKPSCPEVNIREAAFAEGEKQSASRADEIAWAPCPPTLPAGCEMVVLEGDPKQEMLFTVRFRTGSEFEMKPHWHPRNERVTILEGRVGVGFGDEIDQGNVTWFGPGDYYVNANGAHHFVLADGPAVLQITGIGPWKANFLETDDSKTASD